jgi:hypothetical protein
MSLGQGLHGPVPESVQYIMSYTVGDALMWAPL